MSRRPNLSGFEPTFLAEHANLITATGLPAEVFHSEGRFRRLLGEGAISLREVELARLSSLDSEQWMALERFCDKFFVEFESTYPLEQFLAFKYELDRRGSDYCVWGRVERNF